MTAFQTTIHAIAIHRTGDSPIFGESTTIVRLDDEGGGPFIVIEQLTGTQPGVVKLDPEEVTLVMRTASRLLRQGYIDQARGRGCRVRDLIGKPVRIEWRRPEDDWPTFTLLAYEPPMVRLQGRDDGEWKHEGDTFWVNVAEIVSIVPEAGQEAGK